MRTPAIVTAPALCSLLALPVLLLPACAGTTPAPAQVAPAATRPFGGKVHTIPGVIEAEHYDEGEPEIAYHDVDEKNHGAPLRGVTHVDIEARPDASGGHGVGWTRAGEWLLYSVEVAEAGTYSIEIPVASKKKGGTFHLEFSGTDATGPIEVPDTGAWEKLETIRKTGVKLTAGRHNMRLVMDTVGPSTSIGDIDLLRFTRE